MESVKIKNTATKEVATIPKEDLDWFLENGWELENEKVNKSKK